MTKWLNSTPFAANRYAKKRQEAQEIYPGPLIERPSDSVPESTPQVIVIHIEYFKKYLRLSAPISSALRLCSSMDRAPL